ncbi:sugar transferase [Lentilactobacillus buchneri]|uniref:sugar transferase n=1 Tax=Lentilactobacillus buchneri TaxID=1581 RepID=UPI0021A8816F|nr:sugar transferase [Lentilactobacillus buchneri]MCT3559100.1 sugar transferase [Lentilactobacillus buchneri]
MQTKGHGRGDFRHYHSLTNNNTISKDQIEKRILYHFFKRFFDELLSIIAIILLIPVFVVTAILIKIEDPHGPIFYSQIRIGKNNRPFRMYKFRSMVTNAENILKSNADLYSKYLSNNFKLLPEDDPRITKIGLFLRKTSLDELPQFFNILIGDMSLVGPRPVVPSELSKYDQEKILSVKPGAMGLWQAKGRSKIGYPRRAKIEEYYVDHACLRLDLKILVANIINIFKGNGAY